MLKPKKNTKYLSHSELGAAIFIMPYIANSNIVYMGSRYGATLTSGLKKLDYLMALGINIRRFPDKKMYHDQGYDACPEVVLAPLLGQR